VDRRKEKVNEDNFLINNPHNLLIGLIWNIVDERLPLALSRVVEYLAREGEDIEMNSIDVMEIISQNLMWGHDHFSGEQDHSHGQVLSDEEIEQQVQQARTILNRLHNEE
jgi:hypothetical protein